MKMHACNRAVCVARVHCHFHYFQFSQLEVLFDFLVRGRVMQVRHLRTVNFQCNIRRWFAVRACRVCTCSSRTAELGRGFILAAWILVFDILVHCHCILMFHVFVCSKHGGRYFQSSRLVAAIFVVFGQLCDISSRFAAVHSRKGTLAPTGFHVDARIFKPRRTRLERFRRIFD